MRILLWPIATVISMVLCTGATPIAECTLTGSASDEWPPIPLITTNIAKFAELANLYDQEGWEWRTFTESGVYTPGGDYLNWARATWSPIRWSSTVRDVHGTIMESFDEGKTYVYHPDTMAQYALWLWSDHLHGQPLSPSFRTNVDALVEMQLPDGSLRYDPQATNGFQPLPEGIGSALAQGRAVSAWLRAYKKFQEDRYLQAARQAVQFLLKRDSDGGCLGNLADLHPSLDRFPIIVDPIKDRSATYALNTACFATLAIYEWSDYDPTVRCVLAQLVEALTYVLPYYDVPGLSLYNLQHLTGQMPENMQPAYHMYNTMLVWALDSIFPHPEFNRTWRTWAQYVKQPLPDPPTLAVRRVNSRRFVVSWSQSGCFLQEAERLNGPWAELENSIGVQAVSLPTTNAAAFFRLIK